MNSRFLATLQMKLDPELGRIRLEGRPAPVSFASPSPWNVANRLASRGAVMARKVVQRVRGSNRAPTGGHALAALVVRHWRSHPEILGTSALPSFVREQWVENLLAGKFEPRPSSVSLLSSLLVAGEDLSKAGAHGKGR